MFIINRWVINKTDDKVKADLLKIADCSDLCAAVLVSRGLTDKDKLNEFFFNTELSDPFLIKDMHEAVDCITNAIENSTLICVYGDYDCDGVTSTAILYNYLQCAGAQVFYYIPQREEGYGLNKNAIKIISDKGTGLIITVDNGISAIEEAKFINDLGIQLVITDHHQVPEELPKACAVINPHRSDDMSPFKSFCGAGVVIKLIAALEGGDYSIVLDQYADLAAIGTVADVVSLTGENRVLVKKGLELISNTENEGLNNLIAKSSLKGPITSTSIGFILAPRINAAGRFGSASDAVDILTDECDDIQEQVKSLVSLNDERKKVEAEIINDINRIIANNPEMLYNRVLVFHAESWHSGVIGIVCSKLVEHFGKPIFIFTDENGTSKGSARSIKGFNIFNALNSCSDVLIQFGGHELAGGFTLKTENADKFIEMLEAYAKKTCDKMPAITVNVDKILSEDDLSVENVKSLELLEPYGEGNKEPAFALLHAKINRIVSLSDGKHTKLEITYGNKQLSALIFNQATELFYLNQGDYIDLVANVILNEYANKISVNLKVRDFRLSGIHQERYFAAKDCYERFKRKEGIDDKLKSRIIPNRDELVLVYKKLVEYKAGISYDGLFMMINNDSINFCKLMLCIDIFEELGLIIRDYLNKRIAPVLPAKKVSLESSELLNELRRL